MSLMGRGIPDTSMGGTGASFPTTVWDLVDRARSATPDGARAALEDLIRMYWKPAYRYIRRSWAKSNEDAKDLTQGFFLELVEKDLLGRMDRTRFRLRACLKTALQHFLIDEKRVATARKRGGELKALPLDVALEDEASTRPPEEAFDGAWTAALMEQALADLRVRLTAAGREVQYRVLERYLESAGETPPSYADLAREFSIDVHDVTNYLHRTRVELRNALVERMRQQVSGGRDLERELRELFGGRRA
jgi:RNA polymerase sigma-70 factor (ECF subfamily)